MPFTLDNNLPPPHAMNSYNLVGIFRLHIHTMGVRAQVVSPWVLIISTIGPRHGFWVLEPQLLICIITIKKKLK